MRSNRSFGRVNELAPLLRWGNAGAETATIDPHDADRASPAYPHLPDADRLRRLDRAGEHEDGSLSPIDQGYADSTAAAETAATAVCIDCNSVVLHVTERLRDEFGGRHHVTADEVKRFYTEQLAGEIADRVGAAFALRRLGENL
jgi:hypothetical protein